MRCPQLLFACWCSSVLAVTTCMTGTVLPAKSSSASVVRVVVDGYSCVSAYWSDISCVLNITEISSSSSYSLNFSSNMIFSRSPEFFSCPLVRRNHSYHCDVSTSSQHTVVTSFDIELCSGSDCQSLSKNFMPAKHIQLMTPSDVKLQQSPEFFSFTWKSGYEEHIILKNVLDFDLFLEAFQSNGVKEYNHTYHFNRPIITPNVSISRLPLNSYYKYCIRIRSILQGYEIPKSEWSDPMCWDSDDIPEEPASPSIIILVPVCAVFAAMLFVVYSPAVRMKIKRLSHTPSPAPFFQPLYQQYEGNGQEWFLPQSKRTILYKTDDMLTTDAVTVVPSPSKKDLEENLGLQDPAVMLPVTLCRTSYVGLPGMPQAPPPITMVCPAVTSYTQLPCSIWGFNAGEIQVSPCPPEEQLENNFSDSGCSLESLSENPDCSLPTSPVVQGSPPFQCTDYCILNKTAEGVVPVLVTKESSQNHTSDGQQDEEETLQVAVTEGGENSEI